MEAESTSGDLGTIPVACSPFGQEDAASGMGKAHSSNSARGPEVKGFRKPEFPQGGTEKTKNTNSATVWNEQRKSSVILQVSRFISPSKGEGERGEGEAELPGRKRDETTRGAGMEGCGCKFAPQPHRTSGLLCHLRSVITNQHVT